MTSLEFSAEITQPFHEMTKIQLQVAKSYIFSEWVAE